MADTPAELKALIEVWTAEGAVGKEDTWDKLSTPECLIIRPSGNPMGKKIWNAMMGNKDVVQESNKVLSFERYMKMGDNHAMVCYTAHAKFTYKGTPNDDVAVFTCIFQKDNGSWKMAWAQRSTGRKPEEPKPDFNCE